MESLSVAVNAVVPFLIYITFGYIVRMSGLVDIAFMKKLNQLIFRAFFPVMMFYNVYQQESADVWNGKLIVTGVVFVIVLILLLFLIVPRIVKENPRRGVLIQAIYRSNFVLFALPLTESVFGAEGTAVASMMVAVIVPLYNMAAVIILEYFRGGKLSVKDLIWRILLNPLILGTLVGIAFKLLHMELPGCIEKPVAQFAGLATPLALFVLGGTLQFASMRRNLRYIVPAVAVKLLVLPVFGLLVGCAMGFSPVERFILFAMCATPVAASSYSMAESMGGDGDLAGEIVVAGTVFSAVTIFGWVFFMNSFGML